MNSKKTMGIWVLAFWTLTLVACSTPQHKAVDKLRVGLDKTQVLDIAGNPTRTQRIEGRDHWTFIYYLEEGRKGTVLVFEDGVVAQVRPARLTTAEQEKAEIFPSKDEYAQFIRKERAQKTLKSESFVDIE